MARGTGSSTKKKPLSRLRSRGQARDAREALPGEPPKIRALEAWEAWEEDQAAF